MNMPLLLIMFLVVFLLTAEQVDIFFGHDLFWGKIFNSKHSCADPCLCIVVKSDRDETGI